MRNGVHRLVQGQRTVQIVLKTGNEDAFGDSVDTAIVTHFSSNGIVGCPYCSTTTLKRWRRPRMSVAATTAIPPIPNEIQVWPS